jgi:predicted alpha/beta superfamily hydrolase
MGHLTDAATIVPEKSPASGLVITTYKTEWRDASTSRGGQRQQNRPRTRPKRNPTLQNVAWHRYQDIYHEHHHHIVGSIKVGQQVDSPQLGNRRDILVYLPPSYEKSEQRYPVLYMQDGQNLFDNATSFAGEWGVDETMELLSQESSLEAIIVGIPNMGTQRLAEYSPFVDPHLGGGRGRAYVTFLAHTLKPLVDRDFRTLPGKAYTGIMGSSMGGLISLYAFFQQPHIFGFAGVMSPSLWFAQKSIYHYVQKAHFHQGKIYLDAGTREMGGSPRTLAQRARSRRYYASVRHLKRILIRKGYRPVHDLLHIEEKWAGHSETAWARRLPQAIRFFLEP